MGSASHNIIKYGDDCLLVDFNNLFVASSISEEILLFSRTSDCDLYDDFNTQISEFFIKKVDFGKDLNSYSGGEKVLIAISLIFASIIKYEIHSIRILFVNIIDSLAAQNREVLLRKLKYMSDTYSVSFYNLVEKDIQKIDTDDTFIQ